MTNIIVFHHVLGVTDGVREFAARLRRAGHAPTVPDLFDGRSFAFREDGAAYVQQVGVETIIERGRAAASSQPAATVYLGFSLGVLPAQMLAQTRPGAKGAVLCYGFVPPAEFSAEWPPDVPVQIHAMEDDERVRDELEEASQFADTLDVAELFLYPGTGHLFADSSSPDYDEAAADLLMSRVTEFLGRL